MSILTLVSFDAWNIYPEVDMLFAMATFLMFGMFFADPVLVIAVSFSAPDAIDTSLFKDYDAMNLGSKLAGASGSILPS